MGVFNKTPKERVITECAALHVPSRQPQGGMCLRGWEGGQIRRKQKMGGSKTGSKNRDYAIQSRKKYKKILQRR